MKNKSFSEFSYGFAVTKEIIDTTVPRIHFAPIFPSLWQEGQAGYGYDVRLDRPGIPLFLQFKLSEYMIYSSAREIKQFGLYNSTPPYYRYSIYPDPISPQHAYLCQLDRPGREVLYAAPCFHTFNDFNAYYFNQEILANSCFIRPRDIGLIPDFDEHTVCFRASDTVAYFCSTPVEIPIAYKGVELRNLSKNIKDATPLNEELPIIMNQMREIVKEYFFTDIMYSNQLEKQIGHLNIANQIQFLARQFLDSQFLIIQ